MAEKTVTDLAHLLANHLGQFACISPTPSPYASSDDVVEAFAMTCRSNPSSDRLSASRQFALVDSRAGVRGTFLGFDFIENHLRDRAGMRRTAGRAPPRNGRVQPAHGGAVQVDFVPISPGQFQPLTVRDSCGSPIAMRSNVIVRREVFVWSAVGTSAW